MSCNFVGMGTFFVDKFMRMIYSFVNVTMFVEVDIDFAIVSRIIEPGSTHF